MCSPLRAALKSAGYLVIAIACSPKVSDTPLPNSRPEGPNTYYYGNPDHGGKELGKREASATRQEPLVLPKPPAMVSKRPKPAPKVETTSKEDKDLDGGAPTEDSKYAGRYLGTDTVTIEFPGIPDDPQVDDKAVVDIDKLEEDGKYELTVVASNSGDPLCTIRGALSDDKLEFPKGQTCFSQILGIPLDTNLLGGTATFDGAKLTVEFEVELVLDAPGGTLEGSISYGFEGQKEASDKGSD